MLKIFDAHCDTPFELVEQKKELYKNSLQIDISRMLNYQKYIQVFAAYIDKKNVKIPPVKHCLNMLNNIHNEIEKNGDYIEIIDTMDALRNSNKIGAILAIEGGEALEGDISALDMYYKLGVRLITLTWNYANELCDGITESRGRGLTEFGHKVVSLMEELGIMIDVSHISEKGFWDVLEATKYPFVASHSCVKRLCGHIRNLSDEQIRAMIDRKCVIGINFYPEFLTDRTDCTEQDIIRHIDYIFNMGGENNVGLGSDFDGVNSLPYGINGTQDIRKIHSALRDNNFSEKQIRKVFFDNFYHIFFDMFSRKEKI